MSILWKLICLLCTAFLIYWMYSITKLSNSLANIESVLDTISQEELDQLIESAHAGDTICY